MYKERTGGHNRSSTKEKRNTYPPLFSKLRREDVPGLIFYLKTYKEYMKYEAGWLHSGRNLRIIRKHV